MNLRRRRIQWMFRIFSVGMVAALAAVALVSMRAMAVTHRESAEAALADLAALEDASGLQFLLYQKGFAAEYLLTGDERWLAELRRTAPAFEDWLARMTRDARTPEAARLAALLAAEYGRYDADRTRAIQLFQGGAHADSITSLSAATDRAARLRDLANQLIHLRSDEVKGGLARTEKAWRQSLVNLALAILSAILGSTAIGFLLARRVARPLYELVLRAESAAGGARVEVTADDEIGVLSEHVTRLAKQIETSSAEIAEQRRRLTQAEKMSALGEMAAGVAHEVLNPLTGVKTAVRLLAINNPRSDVIETAATVDAEIRRVEGMARRLVSFARPLKPQVEPCDVAELFRDLRQATRAEAQAHRVELETLLPDVSTLNADPELLHQVLVNLTVNACQAMNSGGMVRLSVRSEGAWKVIDVDDEGPGIPPEVATRLFTPFFTTRREGHGLGLAVSQNIAIAHGGRIEMRPGASGRGTRFSVYLPEVMA